MAEICTQIDTSEAAWAGEDLKDQSTWAYTITPSDQEEIDRVMSGLRANPLPLARINRSVFELPTLGPKLLKFSREIRDGRGFKVVRGLKIANYTDDEVGCIFWGVGTYLGSPVAQNPKGDLLGHVLDQGRTYGNIDVRGYETKAHLPFHSDGSDIVGLLCLRKSRSGGLSSLVSSVTLHNEILRRHPEFLPILYRGFRYIKREAALTESPVSAREIPVFGYAQGNISCRFVGNQIRAAAAKLGKPLQDMELRALDFMDALAYSPKLHLSFPLDIGDMMFCNNYTILHSRTEFEDWPEPERRRHLLRLWLTFRHRRPLPPGFPAQNGHGIGHIAEVAFEKAAS